MHADRQEHGHRITFKNKKNTSNANLKHKQSFEEQDNYVSAHGERTSIRKYQTIESIGAEIQRSKSKERSKKKINK